MRTWLFVKHNFLRIPEAGEIWPWYAVPIRQTILGIAEFVAGIRLRFALWNYRRKWE